MADPAKFGVFFRCPNCKQKGARYWNEGSDKRRTLGSKRALISVSDGFRIGEDRAANGEPLVVCNICDEIQPD